MQFLNKDFQRQLLQLRQQLLDREEVISQLQHQFIKVQEEQPVQQRPIDIEEVPRSDMVLPEEQERRKRSANVVMYGLSGESSACLKQAAEEVFQSLNLHHARQHAVAVEPLPTQGPHPPVIGYDCISKPRPQAQQARRGPPRGGIAVFVADGIRQHVKEWKVADDGTYVILELAAGLLLPDERTAYLAVCYVPPKKGRHGNLETFDDLQRDLAELPLDSPVLTAGDMNAHTAGLTDLYPMQDIHSDKDSGSDDDTEPEDWPENFLTVPRRNMQHPNTNSNHWGEEFIQYLQATGQAILNGRGPGDLTGKITRRDKRGPGSLLDYFAARAAVAKYVVSLQVLDDPSSLPVLCSDHNPVLLTLTGGSVEWVNPRRAAPKGLSNIRYQGMRKHKKHNHFKANSAKLEAACRAGHQSFWIPFKAMYSKDCAAVKTVDGLSKPFSCHQGVQQGSPLSPALFGIFVDALERLMQRNFGLNVPELDGHAVPLLLYADDLVSIKKTEVLVFQPRRPALASLPTLHYNRKALKKVHRFKYLGLSLETQGGFREAIAQLCASARRAAFSVRHRCCRQGISSLDCILKLFNAKVLPILSYGCEVWFGTCCKDTTKRRWAEPAEQVHRDFLRGILGVSRRAPTPAVYAEFGAYPLAVHWARVAARFQVRAQCMENNRPVRWAATYWGVPGPGTDVTNTEDMAAAAEVCKFKAGYSIPGPILVPEYFREVKLQEGLEPYLHHVKIANHRRALARLRLSCSELRHYQVPSAEYSTCINHVISLGLAETT
eukprot:jgi/Astpho2/8079/Aster-03025